MQASDIKVLRLLAAGYRQRATEERDMKAAQMFTEIASDLEAEAKNLEAKVASPTP